MRTNPLHTAVFCLVLLGLILDVPVPALGKVLLEDTVWEGEVLVDDNILVPQGITLTVKGNAVVTVSTSDSTKTDPEYMSSLTEITVRGNLLVEGTPGSPVFFRLDPAEKTGSSWSGIIIDGGNARIRSCTVRDAETGIWILDGAVDLQDSTLSLNHYGLVAQREDTAVKITDTLISGNDYGILALDGAVINQNGNSVKDNGKKDYYDLPAAKRDFQVKSYNSATEGNPGELRDEVLQGDTIWQGRVLVNGRVRVPVDSRLIILPGTIVEFRKKDTNGDGIGENGLMMQGVLIAKGTAENPILFRSAESDRGKGDWDAVNIINSDGARNIIEYCQFEDAYRSLHFHFSNVVVQYSVFRHNNRGVQFQESTVELRRNDFYANTSAVQARDSEIIFADNLILGNVFGANFLRSHLLIQDNRFASNLDFGLKIREGYPSVYRNIFHHNRFGLMFSDTTYGSISGNLMLKNGETGLSIRTGSNMEISGNFVQGNGMSGISVRDTMAVIRDNHISENGDRGIGVIGFQGPITGNTFVNNHLYAIAIEDAGDVTAPLNWFDREDIEPVVYDKSDDSSRGRLQYMPVAKEPLPFAWQLDMIPLDLTWSGAITVPKTVAVPSGTTLTVDPGCSILFARDSGMEIRGRLLALGKAGQRIRFTAAEGQEPESWGEIRLEYSEGSRISNCDVEYATWGIHSHFSAMPVIGCSFRKNGGGIRFRSGPLLIRNCLFTENSIGIRAFRAKAEIVSNRITGNDKGIFVREQGGGLVITENNIFANTDYNIWVGDFNTEDIRAAGNWWGTDDPVETFFDARREPGIGTVLYEPVLREALDISIVDMEQQ